MESGKGVRKKSGYCRRERKRERDGGTSHGKEAKSQIPFTNRLPGTWQEPSPCTHPLASSDHNPMNRVLPGQGIPATVTRGPHPRHARSSPHPRPLGCFSGSCTHGALAHLRAFATSHPSAWDLLLALMACSHFGGAVHVLLSLRSRSLPASACLSPS